MKEYKCHSEILENFLIENGLEPIYYEGKTAIFTKGKELQKLLDLYWIKHNIFKEI